MAVKSHPVQLKDSSTTHVQVTNNDYKLYECYFEEEKIRNEFHADGFSVKYIDGWPNYLIPNGANLTEEVVQEIWQQIEDQIWEPR